MTATMTLPTSSLAMSFYPDADAELLGMADDSVNQFFGAEGRLPRTMEELEAWMNNTKGEFDAYMVANPVECEAQDAPEDHGRALHNAIWDAFTAPVAPTAPKAAPTMPKAILTPPAPRSLFALPKPGLQAAFAAHFGITLDGVPSSYTRKALIECIDGTKTPGGKRFLDAIRVAGAAKLGAPMAKTWTAAKIVAYTQGTQEAPRTTVAKAALVAKVVETYGHCPKNTTVAKLEKCLATGTAPRKQTNPNPWVKREDGLTAVKCLELIRAAKANGMEIKGYSKLKADDLRALVAQLGLAK